MVTVSSVSNERIEYILSSESWQEDYEARLNPKLINRLLHENVPLLKFADWQVVEIGRGYSQTALPLNVNSTNQHGTHPASLMFASADYTGGIAIASLFHQIPVVGVHPQSQEFGAAVWSYKSVVRWYRPSSQTLICRASLPQDKCCELIEKFFSGQTIIETLEVEMLNGSQHVATADITYWARDSRKLKENAFDEDKIHVLYDHKVKSSARLIAALRALEMEKPAADRLFDDPFADSVAGEHGQVLAKKFLRLLPQLQPVVAARTKSCDEAIQAFYQEGGRQTMIVGVGFDVRPLRLDLPGMKWFELDLPSMIKLREHQLKDLDGSSRGDRFLVPIDLLESETFSTLEDVPAYLSGAPTLIIWEGGSMYFESGEFEKILQGLRKLMRNVRSKLWMDYVSESVIDGTSGFQEVEDFIFGMRSLGEPFINGVDNVFELAQCAGLNVLEDRPSNYCLGHEDPVFDLYHFCVLSRW